ncbi:hypothetical protein GUJ93_ZPchr0005g15261 [Zizania palustris]|uniref:Uncharacterized protein n=1 Tax=Zizania palustris TaxID=103762 RepID=A0A8J5SPT7_ZIZPA|nr:hypothetical protein GUJ93_ZPchr0005g15261 [Zizania palustris]
MATSSEVLRGVSARPRSMFHVAGFPSSAFFAILNVKLSQSVFTFAAMLSFTLTFLLLAKAVAKTYPALVATHLFNSFAMLSANAAVFSLLFLAFNGADLIGFTSHAATLALSATSAIIYSVVIDITIVVCNLVVVVAAMEHCVGHAALLGACVQNG